MNKQTKIVSSKGKTELSSSEQELLKGAFDSLHVSPERVEETIAQAKARNQQKGQPYHNSLTEWREFPCGPQRTA